MTVKDLSTRLSFILGQVDLPMQPFLGWLENNPAKTLPYHNNNHMLNVAEDALTIANVLGLSLPAKKNIVTAALLHDYGHTGNPHFVDKVNIGIAVAFVKENVPELEQYGVNLKHVLELVKATQYPVLKKPSSLNASVLVDADVYRYVSDTTTEEEIRDLMVGLQEETGEPVTFETTKIFILDHKFYTVPGWNAQQKSPWKTPNLNFAS